MFITGATVTLDVRTTNTQSASARGAASAEAHLRSQERENVAKYAGYYRNFVPFVIDLGGAVNDDSYGALKEITREAANAAGPRLRWETFDWAARVQRRIAVAMVRTTAWLATRAPARVSPSNCYAGLGRPSGRVVVAWLHRRLRDRRDAAQPRPPSRRLRVARASHGVRRRGGHPRVRSARRRGDLIAARAGAHPARSRCALSAQWDLARWVETSRHRARVHHMHDHHARRAHNEHADCVRARRGGRATQSCRRGEARISAPPMITTELTQ